MLNALRVRGSMTQAEFVNALTPGFQGFTSRMWVDYLDENKSLFSEPDDYAGYVINNLKYLIRKFNENIT